VRAEPLPSRRGVPAGLGKRLGQVPQDALPGQTIRVLLAGPQLAGLPVALASLRVVPAQLGRHAEVKVIPPVPLSGLEPSVPTALRRRPIPPTGGLVGLGGALLILVLQDRPQPVDRLEAETPCDLDSGLGQEFPLDRGVPLFRLTLF